MASVFCDILRLTQPCLKVVHKMIVCNDIQDEDISHVGALFYYCCYDYVASKLKRNN